MQLKAVVLGSVCLASPYIIKNMPLCFTSVASRWDLAVMVQTVWNATTDLQPTGEVIYSCIPYNARSSIATPQILYINWAHVGLQDVNYCT
jgi:hypothetical protein